jgi:hypothetical protein
VTKLDKIGHCWLFFSYSVEHSLKLLGVIVMTFVAGSGKQPAEEINATKSAVAKVVPEGENMYLMK